MEQNEVFIIYESGQLTHQWYSINSLNSNMSLISLFIQIDIKQIYITCLFCIQ